jgi:hypothetical protein
MSEMPTAYADTARGIAFALTKNRLIPSFDAPLALRRATGGASSGESPLRAKAEANACRLW